MRSLLAAMLLAVSALPALATPAVAHTELIASTPADGATVAVAPQQIQLTFNGPVRAGFSTVTVTGPEGSVWTVGEPAIADTVLTVPVHPAGPAGPYAIGYRILSGDGHPVTGTVRFTLTSPVNAAAAPPPAARPGSPTLPAHPAVHAAATTPVGGGVPAWTWIVGAVVLLGAGLMIALRMGRSPGSDQTS